MSQFTYISPLRKQSQYKWLFITLIFTCVVLLTPFNASSGTEENATIARDSISTYFRISKNYLNTNLRLAKVQIQHALRLAQGLNDAEYISKAYLKLSNISDKEGNKTLTLSLLLEALHAAEDLNDDLLRYKIYNNLGIVYAKNNEFDKAEKYFLKSYNMVKGSENDTVLAVQHNNLGAVYYKLKRYDKAIEHMNKCVDLSLKHNNFRQLNHVYGNLAELYTVIDKPDLSTRYYEMQLENVKNLDEPIEIMYAFTMVAQHFNNIGAYRNAIIHADSAMKIGNRLGYASFLPETYSLLAESYEKIGKKDSSVYFHKKIIHFTDSNYQVNLKKADELIDVKYEMQKQQRAYEIKEKELQIEKQNNQYWVLLLFMIIAVMIVAGVVLFLYIKNKTKDSVIKNANLIADKERIEIELKERESEIEQKNQESDTEKEVFTSIIDTLESRKKEIKQENRKLINSIIRDLKSGMENKALEEFEVRFKATHNSFYENLKKEFPNLTPNEKKLCAFLRQGLTSKEITNLTGQSTHSVEVARTRLRKKMGLANTKVNINDYLQQF